MSSAYFVMWICFPLSLFLKGSSKKVHLKLLYFSWYSGDDGACPELVQMLYVTPLPAIPATVSSKWLDKHFWEKGCLPGMDAFKIWKGDSIIM